MAKHGNDEPRANILRKATPESRLSGPVGTVRLLARTAARTARNAVTRNTGLSGRAARSLGGRDNELQRKIDDIDNQHR